MIDCSSGRDRLNTRARKALERAAALVQELASRPSIIGRLARIRLRSGPSELGPCLYGNVVDGSNEFPGEPNRIRIQRGDPARHGEVVAAWQYEFQGWADEEED